MTFRLICQRGLTLAKHIFQLFNRLSQLLFLR